LNASCIGSPSLGYPEPGLPRRAVPRLTRLFRDLWHLDPA
jgi:hypothetical protein